MGLNLYIKDYQSQNDKIGSYSGFGEFRKNWAKHLGFDLSAMQGFGGNTEWTNEPLQAFFNHSDCDGKLTVSESKEILEQAQKDFPILKENPQCAYSFPILIEFCEQAIKSNEEIEFL